MRDDPHGARSCARFFSRGGHAISTRRSDADQRPLILHAMDYAYLRASIRFHRGSGSFSVAAGRPDERSAVTLSVDARPMAGVPGIECAPAGDELRFVQRRCAALDFVGARLVDDRAGFSGALAGSRARGSQHCDHRFAQSCRSGSGVTVRGRRVGLEYSASARYFFPWGPCQCWRLIR